MQGEKETVQVKKTEQDSSVLTILADFEKELLSLQARYQSKTPDNSSQNAESGHELCLKFVQDYFHNALAAYLEIVKILRGYIENKGRIFQIRTDWIALKMHVASIGVFGLPHLFHPYVNESTHIFEMREDEGCYQLALILKKNLDKLSISKVNWFLTVIAKLAPESVRKYLKDPDCFSRELAQRIARYEYNSRHREFLRYYSDTVAPLFDLTKRDLESDKQWEYEDFSELLTQHISIATRTLEQPPVVPVYLRDYSYEYAIGIKIAGGWGYPSQLHSHFSKHSGLYARIRKWFWHHSPADTPHLHEAIAAKLIYFTTILDDDFEIEDPEFLGLITKCKLLAQHLNEGHKTFLDEYEPLTRSQMLSDFSTALREVLLPAISVHRDYVSNSGFLSAFFNSSGSSDDDRRQSLLKKLCRDILAHLEKHEVIACPGARSEGYAMLFILRDYLNQTLPLVEQTKFKIEEIKLEDAPEYKAITTYITKVKPIAVALNKCANNVETSAAMIMRQDGCDQNSNNAVMR